MQFTDPKFSASVHSWSWISAWPPCIAHLALGSLPFNCTHRETGGFYTSAVGPGHELPRVFQSCWQQSLMDTTELLIGLAGTQSRGAVSARMGACCCVETIWKWYWWHVHLWKIVPASLRKQYRQHINSLTSTYWSIECASNWNTGPMGCLTGNGSSHPTSLRQMSQVRSTKWIWTTWNPLTHTHNHKGWVLTLQPRA